MRPNRFLLIAVVCALVPLGARGGPITQDPCSGSSSTTVFKDFGFGTVLENLAFDGDALWVSGGQLRRLDAVGNTTRSLALASPGAIVKGPDGLLYVTYGNAFAGALARTASAGVVRFDPSLDTPVVQVYASGLHMANGMTFGPNGDLYVSNDVDHGLTVIPRTNAAGWHEFAHVWGTNGLVIVGDVLYAAITFDQRSPIERIPLADPSAHATAVQLSAGVASLEPSVHLDPNTSAPLVGLKGLDDMTADGDGALYVVANGMGELLRVDPVSGTSCLVAGALQNPSSVRIAPEDGPFADHDPGTVDLYVTEFSGALKAIRWRS